jgi:competence protein ComEC
MSEGQKLVEALLYGRLEGLGEETLFLFARTGLVHLFSASGFHLWAAVLVAGQAARLFHPWVAPGRGRNALDFALRLGLMIFFGSRTEWSSPMVRAFVFASLLSGARLLELSASRHWVFLLSLTASAVLGKGSTLSFLLSACGMAGVLYIQPRKAWAIALGPTLFTLPLTIWCFGLFPPLSPLWNLTFGLLISWLVLPLAIVALLLDSLSLPTAWIDFAAAWLMESLTFLLEAAATQVGGVFWVRPLPWLLALAGIYGAVFLWRKSRPLSLAAGALSVALAWGLPPPELALLDVGQGDALLVRGARGWQLSDLGPPGKSRSAPVCQALEAMGVGEIEDVALSHFDLDHRGGLGSLLIRHKVGGSLWFPESALAAKGAWEVLRAAERAGLPVRFVTNHAAPPGWKCWLSPLSEGNDSSPLCLVRARSGRKALLTGDMSQRAEAWFLANVSPFPTADVLKVAHHGSRFSSSRAFLRASGAKLALIGVGKRNRYGHPSAEALSRLLESGMETRRTDREGTVTVYGLSRYFSDFIEEIMRAEGEPSRVKPGTPAATRRLYDRAASVE